MLYEIYEFTEFAAFHHSNAVPLSCFSSKVLHVCARSRYGQRFGQRSTLVWTTKTHHIHHPMEDFGKVEVQAKIMELSQLPSTSAAAGDYGNVRYLAQQLLDVVPQESFEERVRISGCLGRLAGVWSLWAIFGLKGSWDWPKVKAFREQLEKLDEKTLDLSTAQELLPQRWCRSGCNSNCVRSCPAP